MRNDVLDRLSEVDGDRSVDILLYANDLVILADCREIYEVILFFFSSYRKTLFDLNCKNRVMIVTYETIHRYSHDIQI